MRCHSRHGRVLDLVVPAQTLRRVKSAALWRWSVLFAFLAPRASSTKHCMSDGSDGDTGSLEENTIPHALLHLV